MSITIVSLIAAAFVLAVFVQRHKHAVYLAERDAFLAKLEAQHAAFLTQIDTLNK